MLDPCTYDYAIVRVVPRVERGEFVNAGVVVSCHARRFLAARIELDTARVLALDPDAPIETIQRHLDALITLCVGGVDAGPLGRLTPRERFHWLVAPKSAMIQLSPPHTGRCESPSDALERLLETMVRRTSSPH